MAETNGERISRGVIVFMMIGLDCLTMLATLTTMILAR
jgi:hypothetical protein